MKSAAKQLFTGLLIIPCLALCSCQVAACRMGAPDPLFINTDGKPGLPPDSLIVFFEVEHFFSADHPLELADANGLKTSLISVVPDFGFPVLNAKSFSFFKPAKALTSNMVYMFVEHGFDNNHQRIKPLFASSNASRLSFRTRSDPETISPLTGEFAHSVIFEAQGDCGMREKHVFRTDREFSKSLYAMKITDVSANKSNYLLVIPDNKNTLVIDNFDSATRYDFQAGKQYKISIAPVSTTAQVGSFSSSIAFIAPRPPLLELLKTDQYHWIMLEVAFACIIGFSALAAVFVIFRKKRVFSSNEMR